MISNFPTNKQMGEWSEQSKRESEQSVAEQITKREEHERSARGAREEHETSALLNDAVFNISDHSA